MAFPGYALHRLHQPRKSYDGFRKRGPETGTPKRDAKFLEKGILLSTGPLKTKSLQVKKKKEEGMGMQLSSLQKDHLKMLQHGPRKLSSHCPLHGKSLV